MKISLSILLIVVFILILQTSCEKPYVIDSAVKEKPPVSLDSMLQCHGQKNWDSVTIRSSLIGNWQWEFIRCYWTPEKANSKDYQNLSVEFMQNDSVIVRVNGQTTQKASWQIVRTNDGYFTLAVNPIILQLPGKILFCGGRVLFYDSYTDGCDNYFKKIN
jgi:hypothetical protein